jgi:hypothetical protein
MLQPWTRAPRGNALLISLIAVAVLMVMVAGAIQFTNYNREAAVERVRGDRLASCADAARRHLLARLKLFRTPGTLTLESQLLDDAEASKRSKLMTGHYGDSGAKATVVQVSPAAMGAASRQVRDIANVAPSGGTLGGQYYRVVVKCQEASASSAPGAESEVEFVFRYGL